MTETETVTEAVTETVSSLQDERDPKLSALLRPEGFDDFVGQRQAVQIIEAMTKRGSLSDSILFVGGPGLGKTTLALLTAEEVSVEVGGHMRTTRDAESAVQDMEEGQVLFIDEIHSAKRASLEVFYTAMEDGYISSSYGRIWLPNFQVVAATTELGKIPKPLLPRFGQVIYLEYYTDEEIARILKRSKKILELSMTPALDNDVAQRSRGVPRIANRLLRRVKDFAPDSGNVSPSMLSELWNILDVDDQGLERIDHAVLSSLARHGKKIGLRALAQTIGLDALGLEEAVEPYLLRKGFMEVGHGGRSITDSGLVQVAQYRHRDRAS